MSLEKFLNIDIKQIKEKNKKRKLEEFEPISKAIEEEIKLKKAIKKRKEEYKLKNKNRM